MSFDRLMDKAEVDTLTYWAPGANDGFGGITFSAPVTISCRWEDLKELIEDDEGQEMVSKSVIDTREVMEYKGYVALGDYTATADPTTLAKSIVSQIRKTENVASIDRDAELNIYWI